jgi:hypothetical protein
MESVQINYQFKKIKHHIVLKSFVLFILVFFFSSLAYASEVTGTLSSGNATSIQNGGSNSGTVATSNNNGGTISGTVNGGVSSSGGVLPFTNLNQLPLNQYQNNISDFLSGGVSPVTGHQPAGLNPNNKITNTKSTNLFDVISEPVQTAGQNIFPFASISIIIEILVMLLVIFLVRKWMRYIIKRSKDKAEKNNV